MKDLRSLAQLLVVLSLASGCAKTPPPLTEVEGVVLLDNKPLPNAMVEFVPQLSNFGAEMNSTGLTDDKGFFKLTCNLKGQSGAAVGTHKVLVMEAPTPGDMRGQDEASQTRLARHTAQLKNRPIPDAYGIAGRTPLTIEVRADQKTYDLKLSRTLR